ncbi:hypothetical protein LTR08_004511 [Meristemomyces frigidus]|nr:hypothetical protein LTR08_004511 [Meristemomyces frigidus]
MVAFGRAKDAVNAREREREAERVKGYRAMLEKRMRIKKRASEEKRVREEKRASEEKRAREWMEEKWMEGVRVGEVRRAWLEQTRAKWIEEERMQEKRMEEERWRKRRQIREERMERIKQRYIGEPRTQEKSIEEKRMQDEVDSCAALSKEWAIARLEDGRLEWMEKQKTVQVIAWSEERMRRRVVVAGVPLHQVVCVLALAVLFAAMMSLRKW